MSAEQIQEAMTKMQGVRFSTALDGCFLSKPLAAIYEAGEQAKVPLLAGSNTQEQPARLVLGEGDPTPETLANAIRKLYGDKADNILKAYAATTADEVYEAATHLASARFVALSTWKWTELQMKTSGKPVYRAIFTRVRVRHTWGYPGRPRPQPLHPDSGLQAHEAQSTPPRSSTPWGTSTWTSVTPGSPPTMKSPKQCRLTL